jgi:hypothetical protein
VAFRTDRVIVRRSAIGPGVLKAKWLDPHFRAGLESDAKFRPESIDETDRLIWMLRRVIEGPVRQAISIANGADYSAFDAVQTVEAEIPGVEETTAPRNFKFDRKVRPVRSIEDVCVSYGLALTQTEELPNFPAPNRLRSGGSAGA